MYQPPSSLFDILNRNLRGAKRICNRNLQTEITVSLCALYTSTLHVTTVKKEVGAFRIRKLFYSFQFAHRNVAFKNYLFFFSK